jgi:hypothetical protein
MLCNQSVNVHVPGFSPVIRVKEKAIPALTENRRHLTSLLDELCDAKPLSTKVDQLSTISRPPTRLRPRFACRALGR